MTKAIQVQLEQVLSKLNQSVMLLDRTGRCLIPRQPDVFILPPQLKMDAVISQSGYLFLLLPGLEGLVLGTKDRPGSIDCLYLCSQYIQACLRSDGITGELSNALKRLLTGKISTYEIEALIHDYSILDCLPRVVMLICAEGIKGTTMAEVLRDMAPLSPKDLLVEINLQSAALVQENNLQDPNEVLEYAMALQDTLQNELGITSRIGIGDKVTDLKSLSLSCRQAQYALELGNAFNLNKQVFVYQNLILERFMMEVSTETAQRYANLLFNRKTARLMSEEMLNTINTFIQKDLNLSDAARDLYIHRNTLVYRLDKIQKSIGLDVRQFRDAMVFKLLFDLRKREKHSIEKISEPS